MRNTVCVSAWFIILKICDGFNQSGMNGLHCKFKQKFNFGSHHFSLLYIVLKSNFTKYISLKWLLHDAMNISANNCRDLYLEPNRTA